MAALRVAGAIGGCPTQMTLAPPDDASCMNEATRWAYMAFHWAVP